MGITPDLLIMTSLLKQTNARIAAYTGLEPSPWNITSNANATIKTALDYAMTIDPGEDAAYELYPNVAAVASIYGDAGETYAQWLSGKEEEYPEEPYFLWDQPFSDEGWVEANFKSAESSSGGSGNGTSSTTQTDGAASPVANVLGTLFAIAGAMALL